MTENEAIWYVGNEQGETTGPYKAEQIEQGLREKGLTPEQLCWCDGWQDWHPLHEVETFRAALREIKLRRRRRRLKIGFLVGLPIILVLAAVGVALSLMKPPQLRKAARLIDSQLYDQAVATLTPFVAQKPDNAEGAYLLALANVHLWMEKYPREVRTENAWGYLPVWRLEQARQWYDQAFSLDPTWRNKAQTSLNEIADAMALDSAEDVFKIFVLEYLRARLNFTPSDGVGTAFLARIRPLLAPDRTHDVASTLKTVSRALPQLNTQIAKVNLELARQFYRDDIPFAQKTMAEALRLDPELGKNEEVVYFGIILAQPDYYHRKLKRCQAFIQNFPDSSHGPEIQRIILDDALGLFAEKNTRLRFWNRSAYINASLEAADFLIRQKPPSPQLDVKILDLAQRIREWNRGKDKTILYTTWTLLKTTRDALPNSSKQMEIDTLITVLNQTDQSPEGIVSSNNLRPPDQPISPEPVTPEPEEELPEPLIVRSAGALITALNSTPPTTIIWLKLQRNDLASEEYKSLREWVNQGGVLWLESNFIRSFGFSFIRGTSPSTRQGTTRAAENNHLIVTGLKGSSLQYELSDNSVIISGVFAIIADNMIPLLMHDSKTRGMVTVISALRYLGEGYVIFRPEKVDESDPAGRLYEKNLRRFSLHPTR